MTHQTLFIHGGGGGAYKADAPLAASLHTNLGADYHVRYPKMPNDDKPDYPVWKRIIFDDARGAPGSVKIFSRTEAPIEWPTRMARSPIY